MFRVLIWLAVLLWAGGVLYTSSLGQAVTPVSGGMQSLVAKLGHVLEYAILGALLSLAIRIESGQNLTARWAVIATAAIGGLFAAFDELRQSFVPGREPRVLDVLLDLLSVTFGSFGALHLLQTSAPKSDQAQQAEQVPAK
ncbi:MAG: VanZ family protein [Chloroflexota bacterium]